MHAEKRESLEGEITCGQLCNCFVQQGEEPYANLNKRVSSPTCVVFHCYGFTRIFGGTTSGITTLTDRFDCEFTLPLIEVQSSSIQF